MAQRLPPCEQTTTTEEEALWLRPLHSLLPRPLLLLLGPYPCSIMVTAGVRALAALVVVLAVVYSTSAAAAGTCVVVTPQNINVYSAPCTSFPPPPSSPYLS